MRGSEVTPPNFSPRKFYFSRIAFFHLLSFISTFTFLSLWKLFPPQIKIIGVYVFHTCRHLCDRQSRAVRLNQSRPFTSYGKVITTGSRTEVSDVDILHGPADADLFARIPSRGRFNDMADRPRTRPRTCTSVFRLEGTNTCGLIGKWNSPFVIYRENSAVKRNDGKYDFMTACVHSILYSFRI